jgi:hypothetical protein
MMPRPPAAEASRVRDRRRHFGEADEMHAALDDRMFDAEEFSDSRFH